MADPDSVGIMEGAFFVGKGELLRWVNEFFSANIQKVEQCASGAMYIQIFDAIFPGKVPMHKVNWQATNDYDFIKNYKILQSVFDKVGIQKHIEVDKLIKAKPLDNLEFLQWCKSYFDKKFPGCEYDAEARRAVAPGPVLDIFKPSGSKGVSRATSRVGSSAGQRTTGKTNSSAAPKVAPAKKSGNSIVGKEAAPAASGGVAAAAAAATASNSHEVVELRQQLVDRDEQLREREELLREQEATSDAVEKERDFYFRKLRDIEILCQTQADSEHEQMTTFIAEIQKFLYSTDDDPAEGEESQEESDVYAETAAETEE